jgi:hypothetical protein
MFSSGKWCLIRSQCVSEIFSMCLFYRYIVLLFDFEIGSINIGDFLLMDATYSLKAEKGRGIDFVLKRGPSLNSEQRAHLEALAIAPLRLYEVMRIVPGESMELRDAVEPSRSPGMVSECTATRMLRPGDMLGTRVVRLLARNEMSGAAYPLNRNTAGQIIARLSKMIGNDLDEHALASDDPDDDSGVEATENDVLACQIRQAWLNGMLFPRLPTMVDRSSGEPAMLIEDDYDVHDATALATALADCADVRGDARNGWSRLDDVRADIARPLSSINPGNTPNTVTLFHRTQADAELGRRWFEGVAAGLVTHRTRRVTDPGDTLRADGHISAPARRRSLADMNLSPEDLSALVARVLRDHYANWCDEPIPALDGKTPRQCMSSATGRDRVRFLLRGYEHGEERQARAQGRIAISFDFLWLGLGLARDE